MTIDVALSPSPRVSVIIPATASFDLLLATLRSLSLHGPQHIPFETIVVLNESVAAEESRLNESVTGIHVIASTVNLGLAGAGNRGRSIAKGELLILLHDDAEIEPGWMEAVVETADAHPEAGAIGGKVLWPDGRLQNAGMILFRNGGTSAPWFGDAPPRTAFDRVRAVDYCGTSSLLVRAEVWDAIGGLDERLYPVYYVDVDLAMAIRQLGRVVLYQRGRRSATTPARAGADVGGCSCKGTTGSCSSPSGEARSTSTSRRTPISRWRSTERSRVRSRSRRIRSQFGRITRFGRGVRTYTRRRNGQCEVRT